MRQRGGIRVFHPINNDYEFSEFLKTLPQKMDLSCVRAIHDRSELERLVAASKKFKPACAFALPALTDYLAEQLKDCFGVKIGGVVGFPSGGDTTEAKVFQAKELCRKGCGELDMVMNLTLLKTGRYRSCLQDIREVADAAGGLPLKVIIEASLLTEDEIRRASELAVQAGALFVKTGTGWAGASSVTQVALIYKTIGDDAFIKAAGGIRGLPAVRELYHAGCDRFGLGINPAEDILREAGIK